MFTIVPTIMYVAETCTQKQLQFTNWEIMWRKKQTNKQKRTWCEGAARQKKGKTKQTNKSVTKKCVRKERKREIYIQNTNTYIIYTYFDNQILFSKPYKIKTDICSRAPHPPCSKRERELCRRRKFVVQIPFFITRAHTIRVRNQDVCVLGYRAKDTKRKGKRLEQKKKKKPVMKGQKQS